MHECILFIIEYLYKANDSILGNHQIIIWRGKNEKANLSYLMQLVIYHTKRKSITFNSLEQLQKEVNRSKQGCTITS